MRVLIPLLLAAAVVAAAVLLSGRHGVRRGELRDARLRRVQAETAINTIRTLALSHQEIEPRLATSVLDEVNTYYRKALTA